MDNKIDGWGIVFDKSKEMGARVNFEERKSMIKVFRAKPVSPMTFRNSLVNL